MGGCFSSCLRLITGEPEGGYQSLGSSEEAEIPLGTMQRNSDYSYQQFENSINSNYGSNNAHGGTNDMSSQEPTAPPMQSVRSIVLM